VNRGKLVAGWRSLLLLTTACGYHALYAGDATERLHVKLVRTLLPDVIASDEVTAGLREELARDGALEAGDGFPRVEVEVLRADEASEGIGAGTSTWGAPAARGTAVGVTARAWIVRARGAPPESDTGDLRTEEVLAVDETDEVRDPTGDMFHHADGLRAAARRLGRKLAHKVLGQPAASEDERQNR
jgi:hypothetical protein